MADTSALEFALVNADKAGDVAAAKTLAAEINRLRGVSEAPSAMQRLQSSAPMRVIQGLRDPIDAGAQMLSHALPDSFLAAVDKPFAAMRNSDSPLISTIGEHFFADPRAGAVDKALTKNEQQYQQARTATGAKPEDWDVARFTGNVASPANAALARVLPTSAATNLKRALVGGGVGTVGGLLQPVTEPEAQQSFGGTKATQGVVGGVTGAVLTPVIGKVVDSLAPKVTALIERLTAPERAGQRAAAYTDQVIDQALKEVGQTAESLPNGYMDQLKAQVTESLRSGKKLDAAALLRKQDFEKLGMEGTLGQITRDATQFAKERNLRAVPNTGQPLMDRFTSENQRLQQVVGGYGGQAASETQNAGQRLTKALTDADEASRRGVTAAYKAARESAGRNEAIPVQGLAKQYTQVLDDFQDKIPTAIRNRLDKLVLDPATGRPDSARALTVDDADKLLKLVNEHVGSDRATNTALDRIRAAIKQSLTDAPVDDVFAGARSMAAARFKAQDAVPALQAVVEGRASPDKFVDRFIVNGETADVRALAGMLRQTDPGAFQEAKNQLGATLQRAAFGENTAGDKIFSAERFAQTLRRIGTEKLSAFYSPQEIEQLQRTARVGAYINQPPSAAPVLGNPNMAWAGDLIRRVPGAPTTLRLLEAGRTAVRNAGDVNTALAAKVPQTAEVNPETAKLLNKALMSGALGAGQGAAVPLR